jgi:hypothetical protein
LEALWLFSKIHTEDKYSGNICFYISQNKICMFPKFGAYFIIFSSYIVSLCLPLIWKNNGSYKALGQCTRLFLFIHLFICAYIVWATSLPCAPPLPSSLPLPSLPGRTCSTLFSNFVEEKT